MGLHQREGEEQDKGCLVKQQAEREVADERTGTHAEDAGRKVLGTVARSEQAQQRRAHEGQQGGGRRIYAWRVGKYVYGQSEGKSPQKQRVARHVGIESQYQVYIQDRSGVAEEADVVEDEGLYKDKQHKPTESSEKSDKHSVWSLLTF